VYHYGVNLKGDTMLRSKEQNRKYNQADYAKHSEKRKEKAREYYHLNKEKVLVTVHQYRDLNRPLIQEKGREYYRRKPENRMLNRSRARAKKSGLDFNLTEDDIIIPTHCPLLGIELYTAEGRKSVKDNSASLDRIDSSKGYVKGNVWVISNKANTMKSNATLEEMKTLVTNWMRLAETQTRTKPASSLYYDKITGRMTETFEDKTL
jgi:hypothetical protein